MTEEGLLRERHSYVAGRWVEGDAGFPVENPADETVVAELSGAPVAAVGRAISEARRSFDDGVWADRPSTERAQVLHALLDHIESQHDALVATVVAEAGQPVVFAQSAQYAAGVALARDTIELYLSLAAEESNPVPVDELVRNRVALSLRRYEPVGVVAAVTPYNGAIIMAFQKLIPALMAGNSVILRPSPLTPMSSLVFGAAADAAGLPPGVLSVVVEQGSAGAELLSSDPRGGHGLVHRLDGRRPPDHRPGCPHGEASGARTGGQVGADLPTRCAAPGGAGGGPGGGHDRRTGVRGGHQDARAPRAQGSGTRSRLRCLLPPPGRSPREPAAMMGPLITASQRDRCERFVALAEEHGGKVVCGGSRPGDLDRGYYFEPTVLDLPDNRNPAAQEEIFGPVLGVIGYRDIDDAVRIANESIYGLSGQVYGADVAAATSVARRVRSGAVNVNTALFSAYAPSGGYKQSGLGRERGVEGIRAFQELKHLCIGELPK